MHSEVRGWCAACRLDISQLLPPQALPRPNRYACPDSEAEPPMPCKFDWHQRLVGSDAMFGVFLQPALLKDEVRAKPCCCNDPAPA